MSLNLLFLVEEPSMRELLNGILPRVLPADMPYRIVAHRGKSDLKKSIPIKLSSWQDPDTRFVILHDQDSADCKELKSDLQRLCARCPERVLIRIVCRELEAWYWGDLKAVEKAYNKKLSHLSQKSRYRNADAIENPKKELRRYIPELQQNLGALRISQYMSIQDNTSTSFNVFLRGIESIIRE